MIAKSKWRLRRGQAEISDEANINLCLVLVIEAFMAPREKLYLMGHPKNMFAS